MHCPICGSENIKVTDTRQVEGDNILKRRRRCECGHRFVTLELVADETLRRVMGVRAHLLANPGA